MVTCVTLDPLALRPRLSPGLPLSNDKVNKGWVFKKTSEPGFARLAVNKTSKNKMNFGGLAIMVTCVTLDPLALRPRLSPGLPFSVVFSDHIL